MFEWLKTLSEWLSANNDALSGLSEIVTIVAIIIGGIWTYRAFIKNRIGYPKANAELHIEDINLNSAENLVRVTAKLENIGQSLLRVRKYYMRIQQVLPIPDGFEPTPDKSEHEVKWWSISEHAKDHTASPSTKMREIEPGETDILHFDFKIPSEITHVYLDFYVWNDKKKTRWNWSFGETFRQKRELGWGFSKIHRLNGSLTERGNNAG